MLVFLEGEPLPMPSTLPGLAREARRHGDRVVAAYLLLPQTTGWPGDRQVDVRSSVSVRWGTGTWVGGFLQVDDRGLLWTPSAASRSRDAREFLIARAEVDRAYVFPGRRLSGIAIDLRPVAACGSERGRPDSVP
jgi:hypothetical protein